MALIWGDRVSETTTTTGTGAITLAGAKVGYRAFSSVCADADTAYYAVSSPGGSEWEVGLGTYATSGNTITRTTVLASSNGGSAVSFSAGTKDIFLTAPGAWVNTRAASGANSDITSITGLTTPLSLAQGGTAATSAAGARTSLGLGTAATMVGPSGTIVGTTDTQTLSAKTLTNPTMTGYVETVFTITDAAAFEINPANGTIQTITLGASRTPKGTSFAAGQSVTLMINDGSAFTITWTDSTFGTGGVRWVFGSAPALATSGFTIIELWKVGTQVYGALVGSTA